MTKYVHTYTKTYTQNKKGIYNTVWLSQPQTK